MSCTHYGIPLAPLVANQSHIRAGLVYISNPVDGLETGGHFSLKTICPPGFVREDGQIHPNILFGNCRLLKKIHPFSEKTLKLSAMAGKHDSIKSVVFTPASWHHIFSKHSITVTNTFRSLSNRAHTTAMDDEKLSVFIHKDLVVPVVNATITNPDKQFADWDGITCFYERLFDTEIGHGQEGCHYVVRVVTKNNVVVTAYTLPSFSHTSSPLYFPPQ